MPSFRESRDFLLARRTDYAAAYAGFRWPDAAAFNWALDWFDADLATRPETRDRPALWIVDAASGAETKVSFSQMSRRSNQVANRLRSLGLRRGDTLLLLLGNVPALWETMLAAMKLGAIVIPATTLLTDGELADRLDRGRPRLIVAGADQVPKFEGVDLGPVVRLTTGPAAPGWQPYAAAFSASDAFAPDAATGADDPFLLYFTSGTTAKPKLVRHSHRSYPVGSLSTMYWLGLQPGDVHCNVSSPGWAKHAWSSVFAPWNAGATVFVVNQAPFSAPALLAVLARCRVTTLCAPPTVWRLMIQEDLTGHDLALREVCAAGEPLNPEVIERVRDAWGLTIRDGYGQTETTAQVANTPGQTVKPGAMGRPLPGYTVRILDIDDQPAGEGEVCLALGEHRPAGLMQGYDDGAGHLSGADGPLYRTGDVAFVEPDGTLTFVGRADDVFKSSGYRISPFELESVLIAHAAVAEAAVVPAPDAIRYTIPKAFVSLVDGAEATRETALDIFRFTNARLATFKRLRAIEFVAELPKTISGKIRRVQLRRLEHDGTTDDPFRGLAFAQSDFPELKADERKPG
ncbi:AMP-binding protein [Methylobacterium sp. E-041]|uniref:AMP-binding protein n=1 Tax=unclassified Methylobacterium TaxID=2615210 RepID=UPI0011CC9F6C|nr:MULTISPECIES: AMP-binding protein [unclassified Methylobacterium]MCJ2106802.1 AMP-binding protein [Methylobacterium sp. E-041]TXM91005.1 AMP-binding protein [Methylobacterium sp. WL116]TXN29090.1 AMP-binding protein [Methylobacterium sp. WL93]TXN49935.1 AMP-binding protein [Methylobacterium sp. WL119]TXN66098.1 AMP-binding protein [Methylobacterium sp. WL30]